MYYIVVTQYIHHLAETSNDPKVYEPSTSYGWFNNVEDVVCWFHENEHLFPDNICHGIYKWEES